MTTPPDLDWADVNDPPPDDDTPLRPERTPLAFTGEGTGDPACQAERERVLRHPEIAARLCKPPLSYSRPEVWNGYVPPETWRERTNDSPCRRQLLEIITAAVEADRELLP